MKTSEFKPSPVQFKSTTYTAAYATFASIRLITSVMHTARQDLYLCKWKHYIHALWAGETCGRRARSTIHTILIARYVEILTAARINGSPGNFMSPSKSHASTNICYHLAEQKRVQLVISLYILLFICIKSHVVFLTLFMLCTRYLTLRP